MIGFLIAAWAIMHVREPARGADAMRI